MDISSLPEAQQQQDQSQQQSQAQQNQDYYYDQIQAQSYYYSHYQQYPQQNLDHLQNGQEQQQQNYFYCQPDYVLAYQQPPPHHHVHHQQPESAPGISAPPLVAGKIEDSCGDGASVQTQLPYQVNAVVPPGLNPAVAVAVAALSQLTQFAGTMDAAQRAMSGLQGNGRAFVSGSMRPPVGQHLYASDGPFRGSGPGNFGCCRGSGPRFHGRGRNRGRGRSRHFQPEGATSMSSHPEPSYAEGTESTDEKAESLADAPEKAAQSSVAPGKVAQNCQLPQIAWCELCRVNCTSLEILEQHKNGKRHKKNLLRIEDLKNAVKPEAEIQNAMQPMKDSKPEVSLQPEIASDRDEQKTAESLPLEAAGIQHKMEIDLLNNREEKAGVPVESSSDLQARKLRIDHFDYRRCGMKCKIRVGRGGKRMKTSGAARQPLKPPKSTVVIPLICNLCNVKCDTKEVFDHHLSAKKHITKLKRFKSHQAMYGPTGLQALYPPNPIAQSFVAPGQQSFYSPQGPFPQPAGYFPSQAHQAAPAAAGFDPQFLQNSMSQQSDVTFESGGQNPAIVASSGQ